MKLNRLERLVVNNWLRHAGQHLEMLWFSGRRPMPAGAKILEIGCGRGAGARLIHQKFRPAWACLADLDKIMIRRARAYLGAERTRHTAFCAADATYLPFDKASFDAVFGFGFLHHVPQWQSSLKEIARVLRKGGILYLEELYPGVYQNFLTKRLLVHPSSNRFRSADLKQVLRTEQLEITHKLEINKVGILAIGIRN